MAHHLGTVPSDHPDRQPRALRSRTPIVAVAALLVLGLSGCQKPFPGVTVWSGTASKHIPAVCWSAEGGSAAGGGRCAAGLLEQAAAGGAPVTVAPGNTVGISVDPAVAENGWSLAIGGQDLVTNIRDTYYRFTFPEQGASEALGYSLRVQANSAEGAPRGIWFFRLVPRQ